MRLPWYSDVVGSSSGFGGGENNKTTLVKYLLESFFHTVTCFLCRLSIDAVKNFVIQMGQS